MNYNIITGNPIDGFTYVGPFVDRDEAVHYVKDEKQCVGMEWWIMVLASRSCASMTLGSVITSTATAGTTMELSASVTGG